MEVRRELLADRCSVHCLLLSHLPFPDLCGEVLHGGARHFARIWRIPVEHVDSVCHDCDAAVWFVGGPRGQARSADDVWVFIADSRLSDDGLYPHQLICADGDDGSGVFVDTGGNVAFGGLYCGSIEAGNGLWVDDHDSKYRPVWTQLARGMGQQL